MRQTINILIQYRNIQKAMLIHLNISSKGKKHLMHLGADGKTILKLIFKK
jgi:hypothetical protein